MRGITCVENLTSSILLTPVVTDLSSGSRGRGGGLLLPPLGTVQGQVAVETLRRGPGAGATEGGREAGAQGGAATWSSDILDSAAS